jgi:hypothetical protein
LGLLLFDSLSSELTLLLVAGLDGVSISELQPEDPLKRANIMALVFRKCVKFSVLGFVGVLGPSKTFGLSAVVLIFF